MPEWEAQERLRTFEEVRLGFTKQMAREEGKRCLRCNLKWLRKMKRASMIITHGGALA